jgi:hypothetical protein
MRANIAIMAACICSLFSTQALGFDATQFESKAQPIPLGTDTNLRIEMMDPNERLLLDAGPEASEPSYLLSGEVRSEIDSATAGRLEYRWGDEQNPLVALTGVPAMVKFKRSTVLLGLNYKL